MSSQAAHAVSIDLGDPDLVLRWDNSLRYNLGVRAQQQDPAILANSSYDNSDSKFKRGDIVVDRFDLLSESDLVYKRRNGARLSAALWADLAYIGDSELTADSSFVVPGVGNTSSAYPNERYTAYVRRWNRGQSGEVLDAFVFAGFDAGKVPIDVKLGQHTIYWGESIFSFVHGVSYGQEPIDLRKSAASPGSEAKELFKPLPQLSATAGLSDTLSVAGQYYFGWKPSAFPDGGTYFGGLDALSQGGGTYLLNPAQAAATSAAIGVPVAAVPFIPTFGAPRKVGDWGLMTRWSPVWLGGAMGLYVRKYSDKLPEFVLGGFQAEPLAAGVAIPTSLGLSYPHKRVTLVGASVSTSLAGVSVSAEISHRSNTPLLAGGGTLVGQEPDGDTSHALANAVAYFGKTPLFDSASLTTEVTYSHLDKLRSHPENFNSAAHACQTQAVRLGCATPSAWGLTARFEPTWFQVFPGADFSLPMLWSAGIKGTSPVLFGGTEGVGNYSVGATLDVKARYNLALAYNGGYSRHHDDSVNAFGQRQVGSLSGGTGWDRGWISLTFKTTF
jgi:hypothetical protein